MDFHAISKLNLHFQQDENSFEEIAEDYVSSCLWLLPVLPLLIENKTKKKKLLTSFQRLEQRQHARNANHTADDYKKESNEKNKKQKTKENKKEDGRRREEIIEKANCF